jgi:GAF domain-containing protein
VASSGQPLLVDDVQQNHQFALDAAQSTRYVPRSIMAAPLISHGECLGVLEVLDRGAHQRGELSDVDLLGLLAAELGIAVELLPPAGKTNGSDQRGASLLQRVADRLPSATEQVANAVTSLLAVADTILSRDDPAAANV